MSLILVFLLLGVFCQEDYEVCHYCKEASSAYYGVEENKFAEDGEFPFVVYLMKKEPLGIMCLGAYIRAKTALTVASCFRLQYNIDSQISNNDISSILIVGGTNNPTEASDYHKRNIESVKFYEGYTPQWKTLAENDVAVVIFEDFNPKFSKAIKSSDDADPFGVKFSRLVEKEPSCYITSQSLLNINVEKEPDQLRQTNNKTALQSAQMILIDIPECQVSLPTARKLNMFCANLKDPEANLCRAYPGSPIVCDGILIGLYEGNSVCPPQNHNPSVFVHVGRYSRTDDTNENEELFKDNHSISPHKHQSIFLFFFVLYILN